MFYLRKINKCIYTHLSYWILYNLEENANLDKIYKIREIDSFFNNKDDLLRERKIISFCNIHKINKYDHNDDCEISIDKILYYPSSVYVRDDMRNKKTGTDLYNNMLSSVKMIHNRKLDENPLFLQHGCAEFHATTSEYSKKIYSKLEKEKLLLPIDEVQIKMYNVPVEESYGWYNLSIDDIPNREIKFLRKQNESKRTN